MFYNGICDVRVETWGAYWRTFPAAPRGLRYRLTWLREQQIQFPGDFCISRALITLPQTPFLTHTCIRTATIYPALDSTPNTKTFRETDGRTLRFWEEEVHVTATVSWLATQEFSTFFFLSESFLDVFRSDYFKYSKASVRRDQPSISSQWDTTPEVNSTVCCSTLLNVFLSSKALVSLGSVLVKFRCELHRWGILYG